MIDYCEIGISVRWSSFVTVSPHPVARSITAIFLVIKAGAGVETRTFLSLRVAAVLASRDSMKGFGRPIYYLLHEGSMDVNWGELRFQSAELVCFPTGVFSFLV